MYRLFDNDSGLVKAIRSTLFFMRRLISHHKAKTARSQRESPVYLGRSRALARTIHGHKIILNTEDLSLSPHILLDGDWESWISRVFLQVLKPGMNVVDIGANVGFYSLLAADRIGPNGRITCFEANPDLCDLLFSNLEINGFLNNVKVENYAVYSESKTMTLKVFGKHLGSSSLWANNETARTYYDKVVDVEVMTVSLDEYFPSGERIDLIKIDAEGAEPFIINGAKRVLSENPSAVLMMEFSPPIIGNVYGSVDLFYTEITDMGYKIFRIEYDSTLSLLSRADAISTHHCDVVIRI